MTPSEIACLLDEAFGRKIKSKILDADCSDPSIEVEAESILEVCQFLRDHPRMNFEHLAAIRARDYLEPDPKAGSEPRIELNYHLQSYTHRHCLTLQVVLRRQTNGRQRVHHEVASVGSVWNAAAWHERQVRDHCGIEFADRTDLEQMLSGLLERQQIAPIRR